MLEIAVDSLWLMLVKQVFGRFSAPSRVSIHVSFSDLYHDRFLLACKKNNALLRIRVWIVLIKFPFKLKKAIFHAALRTLVSQKLTVRSISQREFLIEIHPHSFISGNQYRRNKFKLSCSDSLACHRIVYEEFKSLLPCLLVTFYEYAFYLLCQKQKFQFHDSTFPGKDKEENYNQLTLLM